MHRCLVASLPKRVEGDGMWRASPAFVCKSRFLDYGSRSWIAQPISPIVVCTLSVMLRTCTSCICALLSTRSPFAPIYNASSATKTWWYLTFSDVLQTSLLPFLVILSARQFGDIFMLLYKTLHRCWLFSIQAFLLDRLSLVLQTDVCFSKRTRNKINFHPVTPYLPKLFLFSPLLSVG